MQCNGARNVSVRAKLIVLLLFGLAAPVLAAQTGSAPQEEATPRSIAQVPEQTLRWFAAVNAVAERIQEQYARKLTDARGNPQQVKQLHQQMNEEIMAAFADSPMTMDQYKQVVEAAEQDPGLRARIIALVKEIREEMDEK